MSKGIGIILTFVLLAVTLTMVYQYSISSLGATDAGASTAVAGTQYQTAYNASVNTSITAVSFSKYPVMLVAGFSVLVALATLVLITLKRRSY